MFSIKWKCLKCNGDMFVRRVTCLCTLFFGSSFLSECVTKCHKHVTRITIRNTKQIQNSTHVTNRFIKMKFIILFYKKASDMCDIIIIR